MPKTTMTLKQVMQELERHGDPKVRERYVRDGAGDNVLGVPMGPLRALAKTLGTNHALALELWATGNHEARMLACMVLDPAALTEQEAHALVAPLTHPHLVDDLVGRALVDAPVAERLQARWMEDRAEYPRRAGWKLLAGRIAKGLARELDVPATLARIEREFADAPYRVKEGLNHCLVWIGLHLPAYTPEVLAIGERLGRWDPRPIPRGCTSTYAPDWIAAVQAMRKGEKTEARKAMDAAKERSAAARAADASGRAAAPAQKRAAKNAAAPAQKRAAKNAAAPAQKRAAKKAAAPARKRAATKATARAR